MRLGHTSPSNARTALVCGGSAAPPLEDEEEAGLAQTQAQAQETTSRPALSYRHDNRTARESLPVSFNVRNRTSKADVFGVHATDGVTGTSFQLKPGWH